MKKNNPKIKDVITEIDKISVIESLVSSVFVENEETLEIEYKPYFFNMAQIICIAKYFLEGIEFANEDEYDGDEDNFKEIISDKEVYGLVKKFYYNTESTKVAQKENKENETYIGIMNYVISYAQDMIGFEKEKLIHKNYDMELYAFRMVENVEKISDYFEVLANTFSNFSKLDLTMLDEDSISTVKTLLNKAKNSNMTVESLSDIVADASLKYIERSDD